MSSPRARTLGSSAAGLAGRVLGLRRADPAVTERLMRAAADVPAVASVSDVSVRGPRARLRVSLRIGLDADIPLAEALASREEVRRRVGACLPGIRRVCVRLVVFPAADPGAGA